LLKLLRGAGPEGIGAMRALRRFEDGHLWRPLLELSRRVLIEYADRHGLCWIDDPSNDDTRLRRNFLRHEILPRLRQRWPEAEVAIAHSARWARDAADFVEQQAVLALARLQGLDPATLNWSCWLALPAALRDPVLRMWLRSLQLDEPAHFHVAELERQLATATADSSPCLRWEGCEVRRYRDLLYAMPVLPPIPADWQADWNDVALALPDGSRLRWQPVDDPPSANVNALPLAVHYRRGGERLRPAGCAHTRELRLLLQEAGIPPWRRDRMPLVRADNELLFVADLYASAAGRELCERIGARVVWEMRAEG
jgi:tRNA(Ile)-lysidine synthase